MMLLKIVVKDFISVLMPINIRSNYIGQCKHTPDLDKDTNDGTLEVVTVELNVGSDVKG